MTVAVRTSPVRAPGTSRRAATLYLICAVVILTSAVAGIAIGSHTIAPADVWSALVAYDPTVSDHVVVVQSRLPRVVLGLVVGAALGAAGLLMQSITRNPIADPGLLGVNAGAAAGIVFAIAYLGVSTPMGYLWFAFAGAAIAAVAVHMLGSARRSAATPARMALAGAALTMAISAVTGMVLVSNEPVFLRFRYWSVGTLQGRGLDVAAAVGPFVAAGVLLALALAPVLNTLTLGEEAARSLGARVGLARGGAALAVVLLAGAATAAAGPIAFVGLAAAHIVRSVVGPDHRLLVPGVLLAGPALLLSADVLGRIAVAPAELQTGIAVAVLGGPLFIALVRSRRLASL